VHCGYKGDVHCAFCSHGIEDRDHLFFLCNVMELCTVINPPTNWDDIVSVGLQQ
jgi:hypothetical protein